MLMTKQPKGGNIFSSFSNLPDLVKSPEMLATSLLATSPLAPLTPLVSGYLFGKKLFGSGVLEDQAIKKVSEKTGLSREEILLGKEILEELLGKIKEMHDNYGSYMPNLNARLKRPIEEENDNMLDELENNLNVKKVKNDVMTKLKSNKKSGKGLQAVSDIEGDISNLKNLVSTGQQFINDPIDGMMNMMNNPLVSGAFEDLASPDEDVEGGRKKKRSKKTGGFGVGDILNTVFNPLGELGSLAGLGKKKGGAETIGKTYNNIRRLQNKIIKMRSDRYGDKSGLKDLENKMRQELDDYRKLLIGGNILPEMRGGFGASDILNTIFNPLGELGSLAGLGKKKGGDYNPIGPFSILGFGKKKGGYNPIDPSSFQSFLGLGKKKGGANTLKNTREAIRFWRHKIAQNPTHPNVPLWRLSLAQELADYDNLYNPSPSLPQPPQPPPPPPPSSENTARGKPKKRGGFGVGDILNTVFNPIGELGSLAGLGKKKKGGSILDDFLNPFQLFGLGKKKKGGKLILP
jgi:hypothetical protein